MSEQLITVPEPGVGVGVFAGALGLVGLAGRPRRMNRLL
ncbi:PEP-CTERM sorting domain-containing protein [Myxococcota bacterium]|nr:PEP-CTERM sorting domain-containing protein [Myxococcota bacterium]